MKKPHPHTMLGFICHDTESSMRRLDDAENHIYFAEVPMWSFGESVTMVNVETQPHERGEYSFEKPPVFVEWAIDTREKTEKWQYYHAKASRIIDRVRMSEEEARLLRCINPELLMRSSMSPEEVKNTLDKRQGENLTDRAKSILNRIDQIVNSHINGKFSSNYLGVESPNLSDNHVYTAVLFKENISQDIKANFLEKHLPSYPWETESNGSVARDNMKYFDDLARASRVSQEFHGNKVVYVINYPQSRAVQFYIYMP